MIKSEDQLSLQYRRLLPALDERGRREWAPSEVMALGRRGAVALVQRATGLSRNTIVRGIREITERERAEKDGVDGAGGPDDAGSGGARRVRRPGAGQKPITEREPELLAALEALVEPTSRGDPQSPLRWTIKSLRVLAGELVAQGHRVSFRTVGKLLKGLGYSLQGNRKTIEGSAHPDRDAQFGYIARQCRTRLRGDAAPVLSVDTKKKELVGRYRNVGREWRPSSEPEPVKVHDFAGPLGRANPYGVYDIGDDSAWVSVGVSADTAEFAVASIRRWWDELGAERYDDAGEILLTADGGGSNGHRNRLWKLELQGLADELGRKIVVCHFPPGTSKWNRIEHKLFSQITRNWRGKVLEDYATVVSLIGATRTESGLEVYSALDERVYEKGRKVSDEEMGSVNIRRHRFHGDWNYTIAPRGTRA